MKTPALFPDNQIIANILREDINLPYDEWKEKVDNTIKPIWQTIDLMLCGQIPQLGKLSIYKRYRRTPQKSTQPRMCNTRARWKIEDDDIKLHKINAFMQIGDYREEKKALTFWGLSWWGREEDSLRVYHFFQDLHLDQRITREVGSVGATGTAVMLTLNQYNIDELQNLQKDIKTEFLADMVRLFHQIEVQSVQSSHEGAKHTIAVGEIPSRDEIEVIMRNIGMEVHEDVLKGFVEAEFATQGRHLSSDWWAVTKRNLIEWSEKGETWRI